MMIQLVVGSLTGRNSGAENTLGHATEEWASLLSDLRDRVRTLVKER